MALGTKFGKMNIAAWASKDGEDRNASSRLKTDKQNQPNTTITETRAAVWEDAEKVKYFARFKREEIKIQAWENHQQAKTEAEMRKIERKQGVCHLGRAHRTRLAYCRFSLLSPVWFAKHTT